MTHGDWLTLECTSTTAVMLLPDPAGGMTLQFLTATEQPGNTFVLTVNAAQDLIAWILETHEPTNEELMDLCRLRGLCPATSPSQQAPLPLDEMATILSASGWLVRETTLDEATWQTIGRKEGYQMPVLSLAPLPHVTNGAAVPLDTSELTVLDFCAQADTTRQGVAVFPEIRAILGELGIPPTARYSDHASELARRYPSRWPDMTQEVRP